MKQLEELRKAKRQLLEEEHALAKKRSKILDNYMDSEFKNNQAVLEQEKWDNPNDDEGDVSNKKLAEKLMRRQIRQHNKIKEKFVKTLSSNADRNENDGKGVLDEKLLQKYQHVSTVSEREWRKLVGMYNTIMEFDPLQIVSKERVRKTLLVGIPDSLRGEIWCMLCRVQRE